MVETEINELIQKLKMNRSNTMRGTATFGFDLAPELKQEKNNLIEKLIKLTGKTRRDILRMSDLERDQYGSTILLDDTRKKG